MYEVQTNNYDKGDHMILSEKYHHTQKPILIIK